MSLRTAYVDPSNLLVGDAGSLGDSAERLPALVSRLNGLLERLVGLVRLARCDLYGFEGIGHVTHCDTSERGCQVL